MDLDDLPVRNGQKRGLDHESKLEEIIEHLTKFEHEGQVGLLEHRKQLYRLSLSAGEERQGYWHLVNLTRERLHVTGAWLVLLLGLSPAILPSCIPQFRWTTVLGVLLFGLLGGFLSSIQRRESISVITSSFNMERLTLLLRPIIGATAGLVLCLLQISGVINIAGIDKVAAADNGAFRLAVYFVLAFIGGFSERFFSAQIETLAGRSQAEKERPERPNALELGGVGKD
jgi:hypothetical protein